MGVPPQRELSGIARGVSSRALSCFEGSISQLLRAAPISSCELFCCLSASSSDLSGSSCRLLLSQCFCCLSAICLVDCALASLFNLLLYFICLLPSSLLCQEEGRLVVRVTQISSDRLGLWRA